MKKLMTIALGLGLVLGLTTATFAQDKATKAHQGHQGSEGDQNEVHRQDVVFRADRSGNVSVGPIYFPLQPPPVYSFFPSPAILL